MRQFHGLALIVSLATSCVCSSALAQRVVPRQYNDVQMYNDQLNKKNAEKKRAVVGEAKTRVNQSKATIGQCEQRLAKLEGERKRADGDQQKSEQGFDECEAELRVSRKRRADLEERLLAGQEEQSPYRVAAMAMSDAETECAHQAERVLHRPFKDGRPDRLLNSLPKGEKSSLEADTAWVEAHRQFSKAKEGLAEESKRLALADATISKLDASIDQLEADLAILKSEGSKARKRHAALKNEASSIASNLSVAQRNLGIAQRDVAKAGGK